MKLFNLITLKEFKQEISDSLKNMENIKALNFIHTEEHSDHNMLSSKLNQVDLVVGYVEKVKLEVILQEEDIEKLLKCLFQVTGLEKNSYHWTFNIEELSF